MINITDLVLCADCQKPMNKEQGKEATWWVCSDYPKCGVTAFEYCGKVKFSHDEPFIKEPSEMPLYLLGD